MKVKDLFAATLTQATAAIDHVEPDDFHKPTPDAEWDTRRLAAHMLSELCWVREMVGGRTIAEVGKAYDGDLLGNAPAANWHAAAETARKAVAHADLQGTAHMSYGDTPIEDYLYQVSTDFLIHAWDLARALGREVQFDPIVAQAVYDYVLPLAPTYRKGGFFAPEVPVAPSASVQVKLIALTGRNPAWAPGP